MSLKENKNKYIEKVWRERNEKENDVIITLKNERNFQRLENCFYTIYFDLVFPIPQLFLAPSLCFPSVSQKNIKTNRKTIRQKNIPKGPQTTTKKKKPQNLSWPTTPRYGTCLELWLTLHWLTLIFPFPVDINHKQHLSQRWDFVSFSPSQSCNFVWFEPTHVSVSLYVYQ